jgi:hypothetical protein
MELILAGMLCTPSAKRDPLPHGLFKRLKTAYLQNMSRTRNRAFLYGQRLTHRPLFGISPWKQDHARKNRKRTSNLQRRTSEKAGGN